jgi:biotin transport system substrate-specific component
LSAPSAAAALPRPAVLADAVPGTSARDAGLVLGGVLVTALLAQASFAIPPSPVPVTGQTLAVGLVGATLGARRGALALVIYVALGLVAPVYADGTHGWHVLQSANGGYLIGFVVAAAAIGRLAERGADRRVLQAFLIFAAGQLIVFAFGLVGLKLAIGESWAWTIHNGFEIFIVGGLIKAAAGAVVLPAAWRLVRRAERRA